MHEHVEREALQLENDVYNTYILNARRLFHDCSVHSRVSYLPLVFVNLLILDSKSRMLLGMLIS